MAKGYEGSVRIYDYERMIEMVDKYDVKKTDEKEADVKETEKETGVKETDTKATDIKETAAVQAEDNGKAAAVQETKAAEGYRSEIDGVEVDFELQYREHETDMKDIARRVTQDYARRGNDASGIELIQVYLKPTDFTAYYVINNSYEGKIPLF